MMMRSVEIKDVSIVYLNLLFEKYNRGRLKKSKLKKYQDTLHHWSLTAIERMERDYYEKGESYPNRLR